MELSLYQVFAAKWKYGCGSELCQDATKICLARGTVPCDILFLGEGPGYSEDVLGEPFVGPAGQLLDNMLAEAMPLVPAEPDYGQGPLPRWTTAFSNLVCCIPRDPEEAGKVIDPPDEAVEACAVRLKEFIQLCDLDNSLKLIVAVGAVARDWLDTKWKRSIKLHRDIRMEHIIHPAGILQLNIAQRGIVRQRTIVALANLLEDL